MHDDVIADVIIFLLTSSIYNFTWMEKKKFLLFLNEKPKNGFKKF